MTILRVTAIVATALLLAGCAGRVAPAESEIETPTPTPTPTAAPSPTPTSTHIEMPEPTETPAAAELHPTSEGVGDIRIGEPIPADYDGTPELEWHDDFCGWGGDDPFSWWYSPDLLLFSDEYARDSPITEMWLGTLRTPHGLGKGSTAAEIRAIGGVDESGTGPNAAPDYYDTYVIHGSAGELVFFLTSNGKPKTPKVESYQLQIEGTPPNFQFEAFCD